MKKFKLAKYLMALLFSTSLLGSMAQENAIGTNVTACVGFIVDNGLSASDYSPSQNLQSTICQDGSDENLISLYFVVFDLGNGDELTIYDGNSTSAPSLGTFTGTEIQGLDITSTNPAGCLTLVFVSNDDAEVGNFGAQISCATPCARPYAIITSDETEENPIRICVGESVDFSGDSSTFAEGMTLASFTWNFDDGTTNSSSWPVVSHSFSEAGAYVIQLSLTDDNECSNGNLPDKLVYVSTTPDFTFASDDYTVCVGQEYHVVGNAAPVLWTDMPTANFGGALFIPDDQSACFSDTLTFGGFSPGATIQSEADIVNFFINFEHSFMGDITIKFICPNGNSLLVHNQGGGGTLLGEPIDIDSDLNPGIGYDYFWSPTATNGTWSANAGATLPSGTYQSVQPFSNLIGCALNGEWIVEICDLWSSDNGFIFDWSVQFAANLYPDLISFTPSIGIGADSSFISGPFLVSMNASADSATYAATSAGNYTYTYTAIDDFGCTYTDNISVLAYAGPIPLITGNVNYCGEQTQIGGSVTNPGPGITYIYSWSPANFLANPNIPSAQILANAFNETQEFVFSVYPQDDPNCIVRDTLLAIVPPHPAFAPLDTIEPCAGVTYDLFAPGATSSNNYVWYYSSNDTLYTQLETNNNGSHSDVLSGYYYVNVFEPVCNFMSSTPYRVIIKPCAILIPNVFTPNGIDGNNFFQIKGIEDFPNSTLQVYNRWGNLLYENKNYRNSWSAEDVPDGTYYYILGVNEIKGMKYYDGHVTILRD